MTLTAQNILKYYQGLTEQTKALNLAISYFLDHASDEFTEQFKTYWYGDHPEGEWVDKAGFYVKFRKTFTDFLTQKQVDGFNAIFSYWEEKGYQDIGCLAYILATAWHETGKTMEPVREGFCQTNEGSIAAVTDIYNRGIISTNYALPEANGNSYYGRGLVQITWGENYLKLGKAIGLGASLYDYPDQALELPIAVKLLVEGSLQGLYTGFKLSTFVNPDYCNFYDCRKVINGYDKALEIANYAEDFLYCLEEDNDTSFN